MEDCWRVEETAQYICSRNYTVVTLQFPDEYLKDAASVCNAVKAACATRGHTVQAYILADTTYNSLSVDEVAAAHVNAQCVVHYGRASLTKLSRLPAFFVFPQQQLNVQAAAACIAASSLLSGASSSPVLVFVDQPLLHQLPDLQAALTRLVEQQQGAAAAARLVFPRVPRQHMEPARQQPSLPTAPGGCCGGGTCGAQQPEQEAVQAQRPACCSSAAGGCAAPASSSTPNPSSSSVPQAAADGNNSSTLGEEGSSSSDGCQHSLAGYEWRLPQGVEVHDCGLVWVGAEEAPALLQLQLTYNASPWAMLDPSLLPPCEGGRAGTAGQAAGAPPSGSSSDGSGALREGLPLDISRALRRRYFLVQKARDARIVGILVGTLGAAGYGDVVASLRAAAAGAGKKTYTLLMGKPSPAKLANFPEIEVFVLVADPQGQILDSKEYLAPIITPHEAQLAFAPAEDSDAEWDERRYRLDFEGVLQKAAANLAAPTSSSRRREEPHFSLLSGGYTGGGGSGSDSGDEAGEEAGAAAGADPGTALALHAQQALQVTTAPAGRSDLVQPKSAADYLLHKRSWQGVEAPLVGAPEKAVEAAVEGRSGRAAGYADEPSRATTQ